MKKTESEVWHRVLYKFSVDKVYYADITHPSIFWFKEILDKMI